MGAARLEGVVGFRDRSLPERVLKHHWPEVPNLGDMLKLPVAVSAEIVDAPDVLVGGDAVWSRYRRYPVFGLRWLVGRSLLFCSIIAVVAAFIGAGTASRCRILQSH